MSAVNEIRSTQNRRTDRELQREEATIARKYLSRVPWEMVVWGLGNFVVWLSLWPLVFSGMLPLWAGFLLSTLCCILAYLPSHEAQHSIIAAEGTKLRWLNDLVGHISTIPLVFPYRVAWITHKQHHAYANDEERDPDITSRAETWWQSIWSSMKGRQPGNQEGYAKAMRETDDPNRDRAILEAFALRTTHFAVLLICAWTGHALEGLFLWLLPRHLGSIYNVLFLSWAPHHPANETGRYRDTRAWKSPIGTLLTMGMEYHIIHHLYPKIPLIDTAKAFYELEPILTERGIRNDRPNKAAA